MSVSHEAKEKMLLLFLKTAVLYKEMTSRNLVTWTKMMMMMILIGGGLGAGIGWMKVDSNGRATPATHQVFFL